MKHFINHANELHFIHQRIATNHIGIALIKLAIPTLLWSVGTPHRLDLIALKRELDFIAMHHHIACEGHCKVVAKPFFTDFGNEMYVVAVFQQIVGCTF